MNNIYLLDCTLRDGGYINNWEFGENTIKGIIRKLELTGIEMIEVGFMRPIQYNPDYSLFPNIESFKNVIEDKKENVLYVGMVDMGNPVPLDEISIYDGSSIDGIRVIFKKSKIEQAYDYCRAIKEKGYKVFVNFVNTDQYSDEEFRDGIDKFSSILPDGVTIVDTFGTIKRKQFENMIKIADKALKPNVMLCYHAHNNLQQAFSNAETMVEMGLERDVCIDACVFGMGRGAGNLNLELFAEFLNENYGTSYRIPPMLEIMDEYLTAFYREKFWGYSLPLYLSARWNCHPNYAIYFAEKNDLPVKAFDEILENISIEDKIIFKESVAEKYYQQYLQNYVEDSAVIEKLTLETKGKKALIIAPGSSITEHFDKIQKLCKKDDVCVILVNFYDAKFNPDYVFCSNMRRLAKIPENVKEKMIATSNVSKLLDAKYVVNFSSYTSNKKEIFANGGLMALKIANKIGINEVFVAGMDGYTEEHINDYFDKNMKLEHFSEANLRNKLMSEELELLSKYIKIKFLTPTKY